MGGWAVGDLAELLRKVGCDTVQAPGVGTAPARPQRVFREPSDQDSIDNVFLCKLFLLLTHVVVPGNYRVKGIKKDIISPPIKA